jgi:hypothetical protein
METATFVRAEQDQEITLGSACSAADLATAPLGLALVLNMGPASQLRHLLVFEEFPCRVKMTRILGYVVFLAIMDTVPRRPVPGHKGSVYEIGPWIDSRGREWFLGLLF